MKKLVLILSAIVVLVAFAVPVFAMEMYDPEQRLAVLAEEQASPVKVSGELTAGAITPFDSDSADVGFANSYVDFNVFVDEYNTVLFEVAFSGNFGSETVSVPYFELTTDVGSYFGLPVGLKNTLGVTSLYTNKYEVTGHAWERDNIRSNIDPLLWKIFADFGMVQATAGIGFGETTNLATAPWAATTPLPHDDGQFNDVGIYAYVPDLYGEWEFWYLAQDNPDLKGRLGLSYKMDGIMGLFGVAGGFVYDLVEGSSAKGGSDNYFAWGVGVGADYMGLALGVGIEGNDAATVDRLWVDADYALFGDFGVIVTAAFSLSDDTGAVSPETYLGSEFAGYVKVGGAKWTVGYTLDADDADGFNYAYSAAAVGNAPEGGIFVVADIDF
jgi:hypothetical protein